MNNDIKKNRCYSPIINKTDNQCISKFINIVKNHEPMLKKTDIIN